MDVQAIKDVTIDGKLVNVLVDRCPQGSSVIDVNPGCLWFGHDGELEGPRPEQRRAILRHVKAGEPTQENVLEYIAQYRERTGSVPHSVLVLIIVGTSSETGQHKVIGHNAILDPQVGGC